MSMNLSDAESSFLLGHARFEQWKEKFESNWNMPAAVAFLGMYLRMMPDYVRQSMPRETKIAEEMLKRLTGV